MAGPSRVTPFAAGQIESRPGVVLSDHTMSDYDDLVDREKRERGHHVSHPVTSRGSEDALRSSVCPVAERLPGGPRPKGRARLVGALKRGGRRPSGRTPTVVSGIYPRLWVAYRSKIRVDSRRLIILC